MILYYHQQVWKEYRNNFATLKICTFFANLWNQNRMIYDPACCGRSALEQGTETILLAAA
jgi:hypothetical protein